MVDICNGEGRVLEGGGERGALGMGMEEGSLLDLGVKRR